MSSVKSIFKKQIKDIMKNMSVLVTFFVFPAVALAFSMLVDDVEGMPNVTNMMDSIFAGMGLVPAVATIIAEDREKKCLRFLVMAGVKPTSYLLGIGSVIFFISFIPAIAFSFINEFRGQEFWIFVAVIMSGATASIFLGATIGILSKNQQAATGIAMPIAMILGFGPMIAMFNETVERIFGIFYTQQFNVVADSLGLGGGYLPENLWQSFGIMWINIGVLAVLFVIAFAKKGLKG